MANDFQELNDRIRTVSSSDFDAVVLDGAGPIAVEFMSYGCSFCRELEPIVQQVAEMVTSKETICRVNVAVDEELASSYGVQGTPSFIMFMDGREVGRIEGPSPSVASLLTAVTQPFRSQL